MTQDDLDKLKITRALLADDAAALTAQLNLTPTPEGNDLLAKMNAQVASYDAIIAHGPS